MPSKDYLARRNFAYRQFYASTTQRFGFVPLTPAGLLSDSRCREIGGMSMLLCQKIVPVDSKDSQAMNISFFVHGLIQR